MDCLELSPDDVRWSYVVDAVNGKKRTLYLDGRIEFDAVQNEEKNFRLLEWKESVLNHLRLSESISGIVKGIVFEVRQGYKSKDSKRQNADIANATNAYLNGYIPCLMLMSSQIDDAILSRYSQSKWLILRGCVNVSSVLSTYDFCRDVIGFDLATFMENNQSYFKSEISRVLKLLSEN